MPRLQRACGSISDLFYDKLTEQAWSVFGQVVAGLDDLYKVLRTVDNGLQDAAVDFGIQPIIHHTVGTIEEKFSLLNDYVDREMHVAVGDIIKHEFIPLIQGLSISLGEENEAMKRRFEVNAAYFQSAHPEVYKQIAGLVWDQLNYQLIPAKDGTPNLHIRSGNASVALYSTYNPMYEVVRWAESETSKGTGRRQILMYGLGLGYHLSTFSRQHPDVKVVVVEPDEQILLAAMHAVNLEALFKEANVHAMEVGVRRGRLEDIIKGFYTLNDSKVSEVSIPIYNRLYSDDKIILKDLIHQVAWSYVSNISTMKERGLQHTKNVLYNLAANLNTPSLSNKYQSLSGTSAVIVGAGPSLERDVEWLKKVKDYALIIAAGTSIQSLQHYGIKPHLVVSMDGSDSNYDAFKPIDRSDIPFVYIPQVDYRIVDLQMSNTMHAFFYSDAITNYLMGTVETDPLFRSHFSVTGTCIQIAAYLGCTEIIFTGQDLSYPTSSMYATGAKHVSSEHKSEVVNKANMSVDNVQSGKNRTDVRMQITLANIEEEIQRTADVQFVNASQLGAKIEHTRFEPMSSVLERLSSRPRVDELIKQILSDQGDTYDRSRKQEVEARLRELPVLTNDIDKVIQEVKTQLDTLPGLGQTDPDQCLQAMADIEDQWGIIVCSKLFEAIYTYTIGGDVHEFDRKLPELAEEKNIQNKAKMFVEVLGKLIDRMVDTNIHLQAYYEEAIARIDRLKVISLG
ncbi:motility associated factor glycosyltransferase family protein [Paenibacillus spongiae]|uniref:DUF115 domain-containing protein n=1 Tax=Paenibacillus spongiae TaxID=2909671 RepID=A0ABY5S7J3_9BACL|nr:6-hydroxymethylpterin diphosphokinase MptE-like protein [Paenibacillus spongiae]UVI29887.1 DUF115 domain-containing protein [Paenibacillus spongiae]